VPIKPPLSDLVIGFLKQVEEDGMLFQDDCVDANGGTAYVLFRH
jgi:hypothetical protein